MWSLYLTKFDWAGQPGTGWEERLGKNERVGWTWVGMGQEVGQGEGKRGRQGHGHGGHGGYGERHRAVVATHRGRVHEKGPWGRGAARIRLWG